MNTQRKTFIGVVHALARTDHPTIAYDPSTGVEATVGAGLPLLGANVLDAVAKNIGTRCSIDPPASVALRVLDQHHQVYAEVAFLRRLLVDAGYEVVIFELGYDKGTVRTWHKFLTVEDLLALE